MFIYNFLDPNNEIATIACFHYLFNFFLVLNNSVQYVDKVQFSSVNFRYCFVIMQIHTGYITGVKVS